MDTLPTELIQMLFTYINYEDVISIALVNKKCYDVYQRLKEKESRVDFTKLDNIKKYVTQGYRYINFLNTNRKILNITQYTPYIITVILQNGDYISIYLDKKKKNSYIKPKYNYNIYYTLDFIYLVIQSPFNIKCKQLSGLNSNIQKFS